MGETPVFVEQRKSYRWADCNREGERGRQNPSLGNSSPPQCLGGREPSLVSACHLHCLGPRLFVLLSVSPTEARTTCHINKQANDSKGFFSPKLLTSLWIELKDYRAKRGFSDLKKTTSQRGITIGVTWAGKCWKNAILIKGSSFPQHKPRASFLIRAGNLQ